MAAPAAPLPTALKNDLLGAWAKDVTACQCFIDERLVKKNFGFYNKLAKLKLKTFASKSVKGCAK